jgi:hypothetical protein
LGLYTIECGEGFESGGFATLTASAYDSDVGTYTGNGPASMPYPGDYATPTEIASGTHYTATVAANAVSAITGNQDTWESYAYPCNVAKNASGPTHGEKASVSWNAIDPVTMSVNPGDQIPVSLTLTSGLGMTFPDAAPNDSYSSTFSAFAQTDAPGLASLFSLSIGMSSATPGIVAVNFTSNPLLGLNDAAIISQLVGGFSYDNTTGDYSFNPTGQEIDATLTVPDGVSSLNVTTGYGDELDVSVVPEPSTTTLALLGLGTLSLLARNLIK